MRGGAWPLLAYFSAVVWRGGFVDKMDDGCPDLGVRGRYPSALCGSHPPPVTVTYSLSYFQHRRCLFDFGYR